MRSAPHGVGRPIGDGPADPPPSSAGAMGRVRSPGAPLALALALLLGAGSGCLTTRGVGPNADAPLETVDDVDLERFDGLWYVISSMPTAQEEGAHDATEHYALRDDGSIDVTFRFREGAFDGPERTLEMRAWVHDERTRAEWRVQPFWPVRLAYLVLDLAPDYAYTVIGHPSKRYVWIMARTPTLDPAIEAELRDRLAEAGYDVSRIEAVPQRPLHERERPVAPTAGRAADAEVARD